MFHLHLTLIAFLMSHLSQKTPQPKHPSLIFSLIHTLSQYCTLHTLSPCSSEPLQTLSPCNIQAAHRRHRTLVTDPVTCMWDLTLARTLALLLELVHSFLLCCAIVIICPSFAMLSCPEVTCPIVQ